MAKNWLKDKTVVLTGASSGIGAHIVSILVGYGCKVIGVSRDEEKAKKFASNFPTDLYSYYCFDVGVKAQWIDFCNYLKVNSVKVDIVINNAGILPPFKRAEITPIDVYEKVTAINYLSCVYAYQYMQEFMQESTTPAIINVSSSSALASLIGTSAYTASKTALRAYTECIAREKKGLYVAVVCPGFTKTDIFRDQKQSADDGIIGKISMRADKMAKKIVKKIIRKKRRIIVGIDARLMSGLYRIAPSLSTRLFAWFFKKAKLPLFDGIFKQD